MESRTLFEIEKKEDIVFKLVKIYKFPWFLCNLFFLINFDDIFHLSFFSDFLPLLPSPSLISVYFQGSFSSILKFTLLLPLLFLGYHQFSLSQRKIQQLLKLWLSQQMQSLKEGKLKLQQAIFMVLAQNSLFQGMNLALKNFQFLNFFYPNIFLIW